MEKTKIKNKKEIAVMPSSQLITGEDSVAKASKIATQLKEVIEKQELYAIIQGKKFVTVEGWNTLGAMLGVFPEVVKTEKLPSKDEKEIKYLAVVRLKNLDGTIISSAQSICSNREYTKRQADEYVIFSMAQTRATGKAFRLAFSWIIKMAGYEPLPAEEHEKAVIDTSKIDEPVKPEV